MPNQVGVNMREVLGKIVFAVVMLTVMFPPIHWALIVIGVGLILFVPHWWVWLIGGVLVFAGFMARKLRGEFRI